jgi:hypothetical protein
MIDFGLKYANYTTHMKCPVCGIKAETVSNIEATSDKDRVFFLVVEHTPNCEHYHLNIDFTKYKRYPSSDEEVEFMRKFKNRKN